MDESSRMKVGCQAVEFGRPRLHQVDAEGAVKVKIDRAADTVRLFEGKAEAVSTSNRLQYLVPNLVEAMFTQFPGNSGETVRITIAVVASTCFLFGQVTRFISSCSSPT